MMDARKSSRHNYLFLCVLLDLLAVGMVIPLLPYYVTQLGADPSVYGLLGTIYGFTQLIGSPIMGRISDDYGRKYCLIISFLGSAIGYFGTGAASSVWMLFLSRIPVGLVKQTMSVSKAYITDTTTHDERAKKIGLLSTTMSIGFILGPMLGGFLSEYGYSFPAYLASSIFLFDLIVAVTMLPESKPNVKTQDFQSRKSLGTVLKQAVSNLHPSTFLKAFQMPNVGTLFVIEFWFNFAQTLFRSNFNLYTKHRFDLNPRTNGMVFSYFGVLDVLAQLVFVGRLTAIFSESHLIFVCSILTGISFIAMALSSSLTVLLLILIPYVISSSILRTCLTSSLTKSVKMSEVGVTLGMADSLDSVSRIFAPTLAGYLISALGPAGPSFLSGAVVGTLCFYIKLAYVPNYNIALKSISVSGKDE